MEKQTFYFPKGKKKAFTVSYDDGVRQDERLLELMRKYGIRGTFNINSGILGRNAYAVIDGYKTNVSTFENHEIASVYQGQEIASHTVNHPDLTKLARTDIIEEVTKDCTELERITNGLVRGFAYPFGTYNEEVADSLRECGIHYGRTVNSTHSFELPEEFLMWNPTCHHNDESLMKLLRAFCESQTDEAQLFYLWGHSYEFEQKNNWDVIEEAFAYIAQYAETVWMATNDEIYQAVTAAAAKSGKNENRETIV